MCCSELIAGRITHPAAPIAGAGLAVGELIVVDQDTEGGESGEGPKEVGRPGVEATGQEEQPEKSEE